MNQEFVWWISSVLTVLLVAEKLYGWATAGRKNRVFVEPSLGYDGESQLRVSSFTIKWDRKRKLAYIPRHGLIGLTQEQLKEAQKERLGFTVESITAMDEVEPNYVILEQWRL